MQIFSVLCLRGIGVLEVDVDIEAAAGAVGYGRGELFIGGRSGGWWWVDVGFGIWAVWDAVADEC